MELPKMKALRVYVILVPLDGVPATKGNAF